VGIESIDEKSLPVEAMNPDTGWLSQKNISSSGQWHKNADSAGLWLTVVVVAVVVVVVVDQIAMMQAGQARRRLQQTTKQRSFRFHLYQRLRPSLPENNTASHHPQFTHFASR
jgi:hypothetical protein